MDGGCGLNFTQALTVPPVAEAAQPCPGTTISRPPEAYGTRTSLEDACTELSFVTQVRTSLGSSRPDAAFAVDSP